MKKRYAAGVLAVCLLIALSGCAGDVGQTDKSDADTFTTVAENRQTEQTNVPTALTTAPSSPETTEPVETAARAETEPATTATTVADVIPETPDAPQGAYNGTFSSATGTALDLVVRWAADQQEDGNYAVSLQAFVTCYGLDIGSRDAQLTVGDATYTFPANEIVKSEDEWSEVFLGQTAFTLTKEEMTVGAAASLSWEYKGSYSGKAMPTIEAAGVIAVG
ncbi:MAG: hypothetical protein IJU16_07760 [Clostridia bacterium]|nr:hypothetical protein [Clostridia bacterium]